MAGAKRILVIEDTDDVRVLLIRQLARLGYDVLGAADGEEGLAIIAAEPLDLVLCDLRMPKVDGLGVLTALREMKSGLPVIVMSAGTRSMATQSLLRLAANLGATEVMPKPLRSDVLLPLAARLLGAGSRAA